MPVVNVQMIKGRSVEQKRKLVRAITDAFVSNVDVKPEAVWVFIEEVEKENFAIAGMLFSDK